MTRWPSPAKLNLFLYITGQRADGYHQLQTLFQFLDYGDTLTIEARDDDELRLLTPVDGVPNEENLIIRAARLLMQAAAGCGRLPSGSVRSRLPLRTPDRVRRNFNRMVLSNIGKPSALQSRTGGASRRRWPTPQFLRPTLPSREMIRSAPQFFMLARSSSINGS